MFGDRFSGVMTLVLGAALIGGAVFWNQLPEIATASADPEMTQGKRLAVCKEEGVDTPLGWIGCDPETFATPIGNSVKRNVGGALFVKARINPASE